MGRQEGARPREMYKFSRFPLDSKRLAKMRRRMVSAPPAKKAPKFPDMRFRPGERRDYPSRFFLENAGLSQHLRNATPSFWIRAAAKSMLIGRLRLCAS